MACHAEDLVRIAIEIQSWYRYTMLNLSACSLSLKVIGVSQEPKEGLTCIDQPR